ncbi:MAG: Dihydrolipoyl dehydrogenase [Planctomycetes bacterium]|nr:Dihydrolipoyl dehydrogenase [Planctomycetota bacterium]
MSEKRADVVVIGAGPGGYVAAIRAAQLGKSVICIEREKLGGVCLNVGCIPSKALIHASSVYDRAKGHAAEMGISFGEVNVDLAKLVAWKQTKVVERLTGGIATLFKQGKIEHVAGDAKFVAPTRLEVKTAEGSVSVTGTDVILATGSRPIELPAFKVDGVHVLGSTECLANTKLPKKVLVIGGGYIGLELGTFLRKLGTEIVVVEFMKTLLPGQDEDCVDVIHRELKKRKVEIHLESKAMRYEKLPAGGVRVFVETPKGEKTFDVDWVLSTIGRKPNSDGLGLEALGVAIEKGFVKVDAKLRTNVPHLYAIGDVAGQPMLAHKASKEGIIAAEVIAGLPSAADYRVVPAVIFTDPEVGSVGMSEAQAKAAGYDPVVGKFPFSVNGRAISLGETAGLCKIVADRKTDLVLGVHIVGPEASNLVAEATLAIEMGARVEDIAATIHAHPTLAEVMMEAAEALHGKAIHYKSK